MYIQYTWVESHYGVWQLYKILKTLLNFCMITLERLIIIDAMEMERRYSCGARWYFYTAKQCLPGLIRTI